MTKRTLALLMLLLVAVIPGTAHAGANAAAIVRSLCQPKRTIHESTRGTPVSWGFRTNGTFRASAKRKPGRKIGEPRARGYGSQARRSSALTFVYTGTRQVTPMPKNRGKRSWGILLRKGFLVPAKPRGCGVVPRATVRPGEREADGAPASARLG